MGEPTWALVDRLCQHDRPDRNGWVTAQVDDLDAAARLINQVDRLHAGGRP